MTADADRIEQEIERGLTKLAQQLNVQAPPAALAAATAAARSELDRYCLLSDFPAPSPQAMAQVRARVRSELALQRAVPHPGTTSDRQDDLTGDRSHTFGRGSRIRGGLAAAAMIALCLGVIRFGGLIRPVQPVERPSMASLHLFIEAAEEVFAEDPFHAEIRMELDSLEYSISQ